LLIEITKRLRVGDSLTRAREAARRFQRARSAERPAQSGWAVLRLLADVATSF
jgi:hypothetical protein